MDIMLDLETMGNAAGCPVLSIGAVAFTPHQGPGEFFYRHLSLAMQMEAGLKAHPATILWWLGQKPEAQSAINNGQMKSDAPEVVLRDFALWYDLQGGKALWGNGADFDLPILGHLYDTYKIKRPWKHNAGRCQRTIFRLIGMKPGDFGSKNELAHDALADAVYQAKEVAGAMKFIQNRVA